MLNLKTSDFQFIIYRHTYIASLINQLISNKASLIHFMPWGCRFQKFGLIPRTPLQNVESWQVTRPWSSCLSYKWWGQGLTEMDSMANCVDCHSKALSQTRQKSKCIGNKVQAFPGGAVDNNLTCQCR